MNEEIEIVVTIRSEPSTSQRQYRGVACIDSEDADKVIRCYEAVKQARKKAIEELMKEHPWTEHDVLLNKRLRQEP